ncbi:MAG TPA: glycosyltransferase family 8 protein [Nevskia sp.]|nr:glycosyltransferase family 8 protein [Nevskia sp.]
MEGLHIACAADQRYAAYCAAMLRSLLEVHGGEPLTVHFLHGPDFPSGALEKLRDLVQSRPQAVFRGHVIGAERLAQLPLTPYFGPAMWYRLFLPELLPELDRVLYLDVDTMVVDRLDELWHTPLEGKSVAAAESVVQPALRPRVAELGLPAGQGYFNSGVLLFNLERMRRTGAMARLIELARSQAGTWLWPDQHLLNVVLGPERVPLHPRWNCLNAVWFWRGLAGETYGRAAAAEARARPAILHFEGPGMAKPWHYLCKHPARARWRAHLRRTPFAPPPLLGRNAWAVLIRPLPAALIPYMLRVEARLRRTVLKPVPDQN